MTSSMLIDGVVTPIGRIQLSFHYAPGESPPYSSVDLLSPSKDIQLGGVALNCLHIANARKVADLQGRVCSIGHDDDNGGELAESVMWGPHDRNLELSSVELTFGTLQGSAIEVRISAVCFDDERTDIPVLITGKAEVEGGAIAA